MPRRDLAGRWDAIGHGLRAWALEHPHDFALLYGSPVPDYEAPAERTGEPGTAVLALLVGLVDDARRAGSLADPGRLGLRRATSTRPSRLCWPTRCSPTSDIDAMALAQGLCAWTLLLGAVTSEIFGQLGPLPDAEALFAVLLGSRAVRHPRRPCVLGPSTRRLAGRAHASTGPSTAVCTA